MYNLLNISAQNQGRGQDCMDAKIHKITSIFFLEFLGG